jgi:oxygen-independent coproporphyrinogen-3 oxidase
MDFLKSAVRMAADTEITWESSPDTLLEEGGRKISALLETGVNRLNIGVQTFDDDLLRVLGRRYTGRTAVEAIVAARERGFRNVNIDLMYGLPDQGIEHIEETLKTIQDVLPDSVTIYQLRKKRGTPISLFERRRFPDQDAALQMGSRMVARLEELGYQAFQPNQFVLRKEHAHRYVTSKWEGPAEVVGVGVSAYSFVNNWMYMNHRTMTEYTAALERGEIPIFLGRHLSRTQQIAKAVVLGIKVLPHGVDKSAFERRFGLAVEDVYAETIFRLADAGLVESTPASLRLTRLGILYADEVCVEFYAEEDKQRLRGIGASRYGSYLDPA